MSEAQMTWEQAVLKLRSEPNQKDLVLSCFYDDPLDESAERYRQCSEWAALGDILPGSKGVALDLGAGRGIVAYALARAGWDVVAAEPDSSDVVGTGAIRSLARKTNLPMKVVQSLGESLPFADNSFDLVHCRAVLHHARDLDRLCQEVRRVLRAGGMMVATREHVLSNDADRDAFLQFHALHHLYGGENAYTAQRYESAISQAGLAIVRVIKSRESDLNLFPDSFDKILDRLKLRFGISIPPILVRGVLKVQQLFDRTPGRLYTFVAKKR